jgi:hypothetical protein
LLASPTGSRAVRRSNALCGGRRHAAQERREWLRHLGAWAIGTALLGLGVLVVGDLDRTAALVNVVVLWTLVLAIDFASSFSYSVWPRQPRET